MGDQPQANVFYTDINVDGPAIDLARRQDPQLVIVRAVDVGMLRARDEEHFEYALENGYVLVTGNIVDFAPLYAARLKAGDEHPGLVLITSEHHKNSYRIAKKLILLADEPMTNRVEWV